MDLRHLDTPPSDLERDAVDRVLDDAGFTAPSGDRTAVGGRTAAARRDLLLPSFHALNDAAGRITEGGLGYACERLTVPPAEAYGVATFYDLFAVGDAEAPIVRICDDVGCDPGTVENLIAAFEGVGVGVGVERCACLGHCDAGGAALVTVPGRGIVENYYERLDRELAASDYIAGSRFTIADITLLAGIDFAATMVGLKPDESLTNLWRWHALVSSRDSVDVLQ